MKERRKIIRFKTRGNLCQVFSHGSNIPWRVKDVSQSGLAFEYRPEEVDMDHLAEIDIVAHCPDRFYLFGIPCRAVYDLKEIAENRTFTGTEIRRCGLQYKSLQKRQAENVERLLDCLRQHI
jgi:hypothetical protein